MTASEPAASESPPALVDLALRRDGPAAWHLGLQIVATVLCAGATLELAAREHPAQWLAVTALGVAVLTFFPLLHEAGHQTAFST